MKKETKKIGQIFETSDGSQIKFSDFRWTALRGISFKSWSILKEMTPQEFRRTKVHGIGHVIYKRIMDVLCKGGHYDRRVLAHITFSDHKNRRTSKTMKTHSNTITHLSGAKEKPTLKELQKMVGGSIEVAFSDDSLSLQIIVDEEGKLKGQKINMGATEHWWRVMGLDCPPDEYYTLEEFINEVDFLVGHVVFLHGGARLD